jgi:hypothetical protein
LRVAQGPPPGSLDGFPGRRHADVVHRFARRSPWWFCTCGDCRFDLDPAVPHGDGTLYAGVDPLTGVLETLGPELAAGGVVTRSFLAARRDWVLAYDRPLELADLTARRAVGFGVTNELATMTPYDVPQGWAEAFHDAGWDGIAYRARFDPAGDAPSVALFDVAGVHEDWPATPGPAGDDDAVVDALRALGIVAEDPPPLGALELVAAPEG